MALSDDRRFLLSHIRHSFITNDDTGNSESTMLNDLMPHHLPEEPDADLLDEICTEAISELDAASSCSIGPDMDYRGHRRRSDTAQRLEKLRKSRQYRKKHKVVPWKDNKDRSQFSSQELDSLFVPKATKFSAGHSPSVKEGARVTIMHHNERAKSSLSAQIERCPSAASNPFSEYSRLDNRTMLDASTSVTRISVFLTMQSKPEPYNTPMQVVVARSAKVHELIGLICWQYTHEQREPKLKADVHAYSLRIAEESGEIDSDFPPINRHDKLAKFGFPYLGFQEDNSSPPAMIVDETSDASVPSPSSAVSLSHSHSLRSTEEITISLRARPEIESRTSRTRSENHPPQTNGSIRPTGCAPVKNSTNSVSPSTDQKVVLQKATKRSSWFRFKKLSLSDE